MGSPVLITVIYRICIWISKLAYINLLWILFSLIGLVILGITPSTVGVYAVVRKWQREGIDHTPILQTFWTTYKKEFWKANLLGFVFVFIGIILYFDLKFFYPQTGWASLLLFSFSIVLSFYYFIALLFIFPIFVHYDLKFSQQLKYSFIIPLLRPSETLIALAGVLAICLIVTTYTSLIFFFSISLVSFITSWAAQRIFHHLEQLQQKKR